MPENPDLKKKVRDYWESPDTISIIDKNLHKLEIDTALRYISKNDTVADFGCGEAIATVMYAGAAKKVSGFDTSSLQRKKAEQKINDLGLKNISIHDGDILNIDGIKERFDVIVTQRCLINLVSFEEQKRAISNIHKLLKPGGRYIMIENTDEAFDSLNSIRADFGLGPIPKHWHNLFFRHDELMDFFRGRFKLKAHHGFSLYYFLTRVYMQMFSSFTGFGKDSKKDPIFDKSDEAARRLFERYGDKFKLDGHRVIGPIQAFILEKTEIPEGPKKVVFIGGKQLGPDCLRILLKKGIRPQLVIGNLQDNGTDTWHESLVKVSREAGLETLAMADLSDHEVIERIRSISPEIIFCIGCTQIISKEILDIPARGCLNIHPALLPKYRGRFSSAHAIFNGEKESGATLQWIDEGIDTGPVISQKSTEIRPDDTARTLYERVMALGRQLFEEFTDGWIAGKEIVSRPQDNSTATYYPKRLPNGGEPDPSWDKSKKDMFIRAMTFPPFPLKQISDEEKLSIRRDA